MCTSLQEPVVYSSQTRTKNSHTSLSSFAVPVSVVSGTSVPSEQYTRRQLLLSCRSRFVALQLFTLFPWEFPSAPPTFFRADIMDMRVSPQRGECCDGPFSVADTGSRRGWDFVHSLFHKPTKKEARYSLVVIYL